MERDNSCTTTPAASAIKPFCTSALSCRMVPNVKPRIGPINGDISILAMMDTIELVPYEISISGGGGGEERRKKETPLSYKTYGCYNSCGNDVHDVIECKRGRV